jgi:nucleotide-binding universal stress UspA family protein
MDANMAVTYNKIIVPLDGSPLAECVLPHLEAIARAPPKAAELVRVVPVMEYHVKGAVPISQSEEQGIYREALLEAGAYLEAIKTALGARGIVVTTMVLRGNVAPALADYIASSGADLVIMSTHGRSGPSRWVWGSVADRLLHATCTPVMMVRAPGCVPGT